MHDQVRTLPRVSMGMRIDVHDSGNHFDDQTRAYAEYRVFSTLANLGDVVQEVGVDLARTGDAAETPTVRDAFACSVSIRLRSGREVDVASHGQHPYEAIDRAARQVATVLSSRELRPTYPRRDGRPFHNRKTNGSVTSTTEVTKLPPMAEGHTAEPMASIAPPQGVLRRDRR